MFFVSTPLRDDHLQGDHDQLDEEEIARVQAAAGHRAARLGRYSLLRQLHIATL